MFPNPIGTKTDGVDTISAAEAMAVGTYIERAIDGSNGSDAGGTPYTLLYPLILDGEDLEIRGGLTCTAASTATLDGSTSIASATAITMAGTAKVALTSRTIVRVCDQAVPYLETPADWTSLGGLLIQNTTAATAAVIPLHIPHGATLTKVEVLIDNPNHGGTWPPSSPTRLEIYKTNASGSGQVGVGYNDSTASQATYESLHWATTSALSIVINRTTEAHQVRVVCESGSNSLVGVNVHAVARVTYTITAYDED